MSVVTFPYPVSHIVVQDHVSAYLNADTEAFSAKSLVEIRHKQLFEKAQLLLFLKFYL